jgi:uncharacterized protein YndB with AHSA1/START domain
METAMITLDMIEEIRAPIEKVFNYVADFRKYSDWQEGIIESSQTPDGPTGPGTKFKTARTLFGRKLEAGGEVTQFEPNSKFAFTTTSGPISFTLSQTFEPVDGGTRMTVHVEAEASGFFKLAEGMLESNMKKQFEDQTVKLKAMLEG